MTDWISAISTALLMCATMFLAAAAWQAKKSFLKEIYYNDSWELYKKINGLKLWIFSNRAKLDEELSLKEKIYCDMFKEKLDDINFLYIKVKHFHKDQLKNLYPLLIELDSVWLTYATKQNSPEIDRYKTKVIQQLMNEEDIPLRLYNSLVNKMK